MARRKLLSAQQQFEEAANLVVVELLGNTYKRTNLVLNTKMGKSQRLFSEKEFSLCQQEFQSMVDASEKQTKHLKNLQEHITKIQGVHKIEAAMKERGTTLEQ